MRNYTDPILISLKEVMELGQALGRGTLLFEG
jgi:hypothetical protein